MVYINTSYTFEVYVQYPYVERGLSGKKEAKLAWLSCNDRFTRPCGISASIAIRWIGRCRQPERFHGWGCAMWTAFFLRHSPCHHVMINSLASSVAILSARPWRHERTKNSKNSKNRTNTYIQCDITCGRTALALDLTRYIIQLLKVCRQGKIGTNRSRTLLKLVHRLNTPA